MKMRIIGLVRDGGYATHVLVDHPRFLVDVAGLDLDGVAPHACSGLTVFSALKKMGPMREGEWMAVMGAGGLGLNGIAIARAMGHERIVAVDIDPEKLRAAVSMGADAVLDSSREDALEELRKITDNQLFAVLDTVAPTIIEGSNTLHCSVPVRADAFQCIRRRLSPGAYSRMPEIRTGSS